MKKKFYCQIITGVTIESNKAFRFTSAPQAHTLWLKKTRGQLFWINDQSIYDIDLKYENVILRYTK
jgi:hypothetical protein